MTDRDDGVSEPALGHGSTRGTDPSRDQEIDPQRLADRLRACRYVVGLHTGPRGAVVMHGPDGPIPGILITPEIVVIGLVVRAGVDRDVLVNRVHAHLAGRAPDHGVIVSVITRP